MSSPIERITATHNRRAQSIQEPRDAVRDARTDSKSKRATAQVRRLDQANEADALAWM